MEADGDSKGYFIRVVGDVQEGMEYHILGQTKCEYRDNFLGKALISTMSWGRLENLLDICESTPPPRRQLDELGRKMYPNVAFYRCGEWLEEVIQKLKGENILQPLISNASA